MKEKKNERSHYGGCEKPSGHTEHICILMERGQTGEIRRRTSHPAFVCGNCGVRANTAEDLCNPHPL